MGFIKDYNDIHPQPHHHHSINLYPPQDHYFEYTYNMNTSIKTAIIWARTSSSGALETRQSTTRQVEDLQDFATRYHYQLKKI